MDHIRCLVAASAIVATAPAFAQSPQPAHVEKVYDWNLTARSSLDAAGTPGLTAGFSAFGRRFDLALEVNARVQRMMRTETSDARAYGGAVAGQPGSWTRIVISSAGPTGVIWDGETLYGIEPGDVAGETRMFRAQDITMPPGAMTCGAHGPAENAAVMFAELSTLTPPIAYAAGATLNLNLGVVSDAEFSALHLDPAAAMLTRVNTIDGIFSEQLGVQITVAQSDVFTDSASDPFSDTTVADELLEEVALFRGDTATQDAQGLTHLFTGRELDESTVGVAYIGAVCSRRVPFDNSFAPRARSFGAGLTQANATTGSAMVQSLIAAHEIGHNFSAPHDGDSSGECAAAPSGYLMSASLNPFSLNADQFSQCSIDVISAALPSYGCLTPIAAVDLGIEGASDSSSPLAEADFGYTVTIANLGTDVAADAAVQLSFDTDLTVVSVTPAAGTCGPAAANVACDLGDVPGSSTRAIDVTLRSAAAGTRTITGTVSAPDDNFAGNDTFSDSVQVTPASDIALITNAQTLELDAATTITATLENRSSGTASNVAVTGTWSDGIEVAAATLSGNACSIDPPMLRFTCQIAQLSGLDSAALSIDLTGIESGSQVLTLNASAQQSDPNAGNNSASMALQVNAAPVTTAPADPAAQDGGGGGGGSLGPLGLLALFGLRRRRKSAAQKANFS